MEKDRQTKIIAIVALFIGVATLTIGFAAFSAKLIIKPKATVTPDADSFKVVLSTEQNKETTGTIVSTGNGAEATIDNTGENPTISNLKANFTKPGQRVEYDFYAVNTGDLEAYLNRVEFTTADGTTENKVCTAGEGTTQTLVDSACSSIRVTVKVDDEDAACATSTYNAHSLAKNVGEKVKVTIEYAKSGAVADGPFEVSFGDITLNYSTTDSEGKSIGACTPFETQIAARPMETIGRTNITDADGDGKISKSDKVTLGTESFYVMSADEISETVTMLAEWNLNVGNKKVSGTEGMQNSACKAWVSGLDESDWKCTIEFSSTNYWDGTVSTYPAWVYNENNDVVRPLVESYVNELRRLGYSSVTGRLIQHEELVTLGCSAAGGTGACNSAPSWVKSTTFWTGSAGTSTNAWFVSTDSNFNYSYTYSYSTSYGVRPVITINASEI